MITHVIGDATRPLPVGTSRAICHVCNNQGAWGAGFSGQITKKIDTFPENRYRHIMKDASSEHILGEIDALKIFGLPDGIERTMSRRNEIPYKERPQLYVINMIAQNGLPSRDNPSPFDLQAFSECLKKVSKWVYEKHGKLFNNFTMHMPRVGAGLGGGNWQDIEKVIESRLSGLDVYIYTLEKEKEDFPNTHYTDRSIITNE